MSLPKSKLLLKVKEFTIDEFIAVLNNSKWKYTSSFDYIESEINDNLKEYIEENKLNGKDSDLIAIYDKPTMIYDNPNDHKEVTFSHRITSTFEDILIDYSNAYSMIHINDSKECILYCEDMPNEACFTKGFVITCPDDNDYYLTDSEIQEVLEYYVEVPMNITSIGIHELELRTLLDTEQPNLEHSQIYIKE